MNSAERSSPFFGPGGNGDTFRATGLKTSDIPLWLNEQGLDAYEYEAGRGISATPAQLRALGKNAAAAGIRLSLHAPYFISLSGVVMETRLKSIDYIKQSVEAAEIMGAETIVVHTGSAAKISREEAMRLAADTLYKTLEAIPDSRVKIGLETMGKINQLGTLSEVLSLCAMDKRLVPVVDFGHMNARELGGRFRGKDDYRSVFEQIANTLDASSARNLHCHFSKIEWSKSGEKCHLTFEDTTFGPAFEPLMEVILSEKLTPTIICESAGSQTEDAYSMKKYYYSLRSR